MNKSDESEVISLVLVSGCQRFQSDRAIHFAMLKAAFSDDFSDPESSVEHMFVNGVYFDGETIQGVLRSAPNWVK